MSNSPAGRRPPRQRCAMRTGSISGNSVACTNVSRSIDEPRALDDRAAAAPACSAALFREHRVAAAQHVERGDVQNQMAAGLQHAPHLPHARRARPRPAGTGTRRTTSPRRSVASRNGIAAMLARATARRPSCRAERQPVPGEIEPVRVAELAQHRRRWRRCRSRSRAAAASRGRRPRARPPGRTNQRKPRNQKCDCSAREVSSSRRSMRLVRAKLPRERGERPMLPYRLACVRAGCAEATLVVLAATRAHGRCSPIRSPSARPHRPRQHRRWPLEHLGRVVGRARADDRIRFASFTPTSSTRTATRSPSPRPTSAPARSARPSGR